MSIGSIDHSSERSPKIFCFGRKLVRWGFCAATIFTSCLPVHAQNQNARPSPVAVNSDLGRENASRVAATAAEIKAVLLKDAGLMVELKRWLAKDATDHGQVITDADLTNDAIFERLEGDIPFRSVATGLVQRYGYLVPKLNPDSELAKEHELLVQERVKWLAQSREEELSQARQATKMNTQEAEACGRQTETVCNTDQTRSPQGGGPSRDPQLSEPPSDTRPAPNTPTYPRDNNGGALERAGWNQSDTDLGMRSPDSQFGAAQDAGTSGNGSASTRPLFPSRGNPSVDAQQNDPLLAGNSQSLGTRDPQGQASDGISLEPSAPRNSESNMPSIGTSQAQPYQPYQPDGRDLRTQRQPSDLVRAANPYENIPSLYDMYVQANFRPATPRRFGIDVFEKRVRDPRTIPMDLPAGPDYVVGPGDGLAIDMWGGVSQRLYRAVDREGRISLPEVGPVLVSGKSLADVQQSLQQILRTEFRDVSADVSLSRLRTIRVYEVGDVTNPGAYDVSSLSTPLNALFMADGPTARGSLRIVRHYRGDQLIQTVDLYDLLLHGVRGNVLRLENGDSILVPPIGPQVTVEGMVRRPAIYELKDEKNLASVLELAGGLLPAAAVQHIEVQRLVAHEKQTMLSLDIQDASDSAKVTKQLESFEIRDGDKIRIFPIAPFNQDAIYLEGHVIRPGRYSYRDGMRVTDVIASYNDLLPEPATQYAEIIRLNAPDFRPSVESFDLAEALSNPAQAPILNPMDTLRVFSRYDFENPPTVSVWGDVRNPGTFRTSGQIRLVDAIHLAGGVGPDVQNGDAQVFRYLPDGKMKVLSVSLNLATSGDPAQNILLETRDRLLIHRNPDAVQPMTVNIEGEVGKPGRYPLATNMTTADLIRVGGGLKPSADTITADLTHFQWNDSGQLSGQHQQIAIAAALAGDSQANVALHNGDVLTVRQVPGWNDLGASITIKGEVKHPGTYGIRPGERLSSILERAGGYQPDAYPYGAVLQRVQVRELEAVQQNELILRVKDAESNIQLLPDTDPKQKQAKEIALQQWQTTLTQLSSTPPSGRVAIQVSSQVSRWKDTTADVEVRADDVLIVPKKPSYVMITGQVFNPTAVSFRPGKSANWYLSQGGGPSPTANKKAIFVIRADGSVISSNSSLWSGSSLNAVLQPGDTVVVPEKALGGGIQWQNVLTAASLATSVASTVFIATRY
jgi:polysaccharide biosynthesis/export protein